MIFFIWLALKDLEELEEYEKTPFWSIFLVDNKKESDLYFEKKAYDKALAVYKDMLDKFPLNENSPFIQDKIQG